MADLPPLATPAQAAAYLQTTVAALAQDRYRRRGLPWCKVAGRVRYRREDVLNYLAANTFGGDAA
ncbi:helix-turn-helix domain-containing protein [Mycobacterium riyadhense]|uniref:helix-turn-helix domain-containing protein n=1 Tax=Mycobacterium riyadhense TaxID=486698 RepID=UPI00195722CE|nr:helix-turn-helix domain-containing protein [Mycobacterium riyadhense]